MHYVPSQSGVPELGKQESLSLRLSFQSFLCLFVFWGVFLEIKEVFLSDAEPPVSFF